MHVQPRQLYMGCNSLLPGAARRASLYARYRGCSANGQKSGASVYWPMSPIVKIFWRDRPEAILWLRIGYRTYQRQVPQFCMCGVACRTAGDIPHLSVSDWATPSTATAPLCILKIANTSHTFARLAGMPFLQPLPRKEEAGSICLRST